MRRGIAWISSRLLIIMTMKLGFYLDNAVWHLITQLLSKIVTSCFPHFSLKDRIFIVDRKWLESQRDLFPSFRLPINVIKEFIVKLNTRAESSHIKNQPSNNHNNHSQEPKLSVMMNQQFFFAPPPLIVSEVLISRK